jgi:subfamily B ATP-binding cassette protein MsbA
MSEPAAPEQQTADLERVRLGGEWPAIQALYGVCGPRKRVLLLIVALAILAFLLEGIGIGLLIPLAETFLADDGQGGSFGPFTSLMQTLTAPLPADYRLPLIAGFVFLLILLKTVVIYSHHVLSVWLSEIVGRDLRLELFEKMLGIGILTLERLGRGRLHNTIYAQISHVTDGLQTLSRMIASAAAAAVFVGLLLLISMPLTALVVAGFLLISLIMLAVRRGAQRFGRDWVKAFAVLSDRIDETLTHSRLVRTFGTAGFEIRRFGNAAEQVRKASLRNQMLAGIPTPATELLAVPLMFAAIGFGLALEIGMPTLLAYLLLLYRLQPHVRHLDHLRVELASLTGPIEDIVTLRRLDDPTAPRSGSRPVARIDREVRFSGVSFDYGASEAVGISDVSFSIAKGQVVALVGPSGAGKSTIVALLHRLFDPSRGQILVDGVPLPELDLAAWRQRLAFAGQDIELMGGTVRDNIAYGCPEVSDAAIREAARLAHADRFIEELPEGYASRIGGRGLTLSGGQRQRLTLARALLRRPDLLVLDEATNALDAEAEHVVLERLHAARGDMAMLVIAHRLNTVRHADIVVVLDAGRVIEIGPPSELLADTGAFARLWARQIGQRGELFVD